MMTQTVIGMFDNAVDAQHAVQKLCNNGFLREHIEVTSSGEDDTSTSGIEVEGGGLSKFFKNLFSNREDSDKYVRVAMYSESIVSVQVQTTLQAESAAGILDACGAVNVDDRAASLTGAVIVDDRAASLTGAVNVDDRAASSTGAVNVDDRAASLNYSQPKVATLSDETTERLSENVLQPGFGAKDAQRTGKTTRIPIVAENLQVGTPEVLTNGTRVSSRIIERTPDESLRMRHETTALHTTPFDRSASGELKNFTPHQIELIETAEVPVISKVARVVEEVRVGKEVSEKIETVTGTARRTEIDVEDIDKDGARL